MEFVHDSISLNRGKIIHHVFVSGICNLQPLHNARVREARIQIHTHISIALAFSLHFFVLLRIHLQKVRSGVLLAFTFMNLMLNLLFVVR